MWFKHRAWIPVAWLLSIVNVVSVWFAAAPAEPWHATVHAMLAVAFGVGAHRLMTRHNPLRAATGLGDDRVQRLEQALDSMALEIERIGEGQRYVTKVLTERVREPGRSEAHPDSVPASTKRSL